MRAPHDPRRSVEQSSSVKQEPHIGSRPAGRGAQKGPARGANNALAPARFLRKVCLPRRRGFMLIANITRRGLFGLGAGAVGALTSGAALAQKKVLKVAAIYTVPVEQQWVSRIHKALNAAKDRGDVTYKWSENVANNDYERIMRQYAEEGNDLVIGEIFGVERAARRVAANYPEGRLPDGLVLRPVEAEPRGLRQLHPRAVLPDRHGGRQGDEVEHHRHGRRLRHPRGQPADERLHGRRARGQSERQVPRHASSTPGTTRRRPRKPPSP